MAKATVFDPARHHLNPLSDADYHYIVSFIDVLDALFPRGDNTLTKDTGLDFILSALQFAPKSLRHLIPPPAAKATTGHVWAYNKINRILASPVLSRVFRHDANQFSMTTSRPIFARLDRSKLGDFDALVLGLILIARYQGQIIVPDLGFYGRDTHVSLLRQNRLIAGLRRLSELPLQLRQEILLVKDKYPSGVLYEDAEIIARYEGLTPDTNGFNDFVEKAIAG